MNATHAGLAVNRIENLLTSQKVFQQALFNAASQDQSPAQKLAIKTLNDLCNITSSQVEAALVDLRQQVLIDAYNSNNSKD